MAVESTVTLSAKQLQSIVKHANGGSSNITIKPNKRKVVVTSPQVKHSIDVEKKVRFKNGSKWTYLSVFMSALCGFKKGEFR